MRWIGPHRPPVVPMAPCVCVCVFVCACVCVCDAPPHTESMPKRCVTMWRRRISISMMPQLV